MKKAYDYNACVSLYRDLKSDQSEWEADWRQISQYLLPGRGIYTHLSKPQKRKLTSPKVVNPVAEDSLYILTSGMHSRLTSPSMPWFMLEWADVALHQHKPLVLWLQECSRILHSALHRSNFYSIINSFYIEYAGFGTACTYMGEDSGDVDTPFRFELLTAGEYVFSVGPDGLPSAFIRPIYMTPSQLVERFPDTASKEIKDKVKKGQSGIHTTYLTVLECVFKSNIVDKNYTRYFYETTSSASRAAYNHSPSKKPLEVGGFYEFPYPLARWGTIGQDTLGIGPGSRALPQIKRLQEMEKALLMATHKTINPPLNAPSRMKGKVKSLPGGVNYYAHPQEAVTQMYNVNFDYNGVGGVIERTEKRIRDCFFNDVFLMGGRDPNATPYKATEVMAREQEGLSILGPVVERLQHEYFKPVIERGFNILLRKGMFPELPAQYAKLAGDYVISLVSPMATAQRSAALGGINSFLGFIGQGAQFDQQIMDKVDMDAAVDVYGEITGVDQRIIRPDDAVQQIREDRQKAMQEQKEKEEAMMGAQAGVEADLKTAQASKARAEAGETYISGQSESIM